MEKKNWRELNWFHLRFHATEDALRHTSLSSYVHDNPELTYKEYVAKAIYYKISYMGEDDFNKLGFGEKDKLSPSIPEAFTQSATSAPNYSSPTN